MHLEKEIEERYISELDKLINRFFKLSTIFVEYSCYAPGMHDVILYNSKSNKLTYDHEYFVFTKSTKTLKSIKMLLKEGQNEDVIILLRSIYENYLNARYLNEHEDEYTNFLENPLNVAYGFYIMESTGQITNRDDRTVVGEQKNPSKMVLGKDKHYFYDFYDIFSRYSHCNAGIIEHYMEGANFTIEKENKNLETRLFVVFVYTKLFEHIVTVEGEDFKNHKIEKDCYEIVLESLELQEQIFQALIEQYNANDSTFLKYSNKKMKGLLKDMKKSLKEELGSVKKHNN